MTSMVSVLSNARQNYVIIKSFLFSFTFVLVPNGTAKLLTKQCTDEIVWKLVSNEQKLV